MTTTAKIQEEAARWFVRLNDADAPVDAWMDFQAWLEADDAHRAAYDAVEMTWVDLDLAADAPLEFANDEVVVRDVVGRPTGRKASRPAWLIPLVATAAALLLVIGIGPQVGLLTPSQHYSTENAPRTIELSDGSHIYMNSRSSLSVRVKPGDRAVTLDRGEAAFDVRHDPSRPFVVSAGSRSVQVLGTAFDVIRHGDQFSVAVQRGVVSVKPAATDHAVRLTAGQRMVQMGEARAVVTQDTTDATAWRNGVLVYRDRPLSDIANDLSRYLGKPVSVSESARSVRFTGALQIGDEAAMLKQLQDFLPIRARRSPTEVRLTARDGA